MSLTPSRGRLFQTLHPLVQLSGFKRRNLRVQKPSHVAGLGGRQIAGRDCGKHRRYSVRSVPGTFDLRKVERHRTILAGWNEAIDTKAKGRKIATFGKVDRLPSKDLGLASPSSNACAANVVAFRDPFGRPLGLPECPGLNRVSPKTALATAPFLFLPGCSMHQGSSEWTNRNNCTLCNRRFRLCWVIDEARATKCENKIKCSAQDAPHRCCRFSTYLTPSTKRPCACFASNAERSSGPTRGRTASATQSKRAGPLVHQERRWQQRRFSFPPPSPRCIEEKAAKGIVAAGLFSQFWDGRGETPLAATGDQAVGRSAKIVKISIKQSRTDPEKPSLVHCGLSPAGPTPAVQ